MANYTVRLDQAAINALSQNGLIDQATKRVAVLVQSRARDNLLSADRMATGKLADSISVEKVASQPCTYEVSTGVPYARWQEDGRGPVRPVRAKALRFTPKRSGTVVFTQYSGPAPGIRFMWRAANSINRTDWNG